MTRVIKADRRIDTREGDLCLWWNRDGVTQFIPVDDIEDAIQSVEQLTLSDLEDPDVTFNACGLEVFQGGEWHEWYDEQDQDITEIISQREEVQ